MKDLPIPELIHVSTKYLFNIQATSSPGHKEYSQSGKSENQKKDSAPCAAEQREHSTQLLGAAAYSSTSLCWVQTECIFYTDLQRVDLM